MEERRSIQQSIREMADGMGRSDFVAVCIDLLSGAPRERYVEELRALSGHRWNPGDPVFDRSKWGDYWVRTWGARGLLYVWEDVATPSIVAGLADEHYRPAEMCLKVAIRHEVAGTGDGAALLARHELSRVRVHALRCLGMTGDSEHVEVAREALTDSDDEVRRQAFRAFEELRARLDF